MKFQKIATFLLTFTTAFLAAAAAFAQSGEGASGSSDDIGLKFLAAALALGLPAMGGALGQGRAAAAALEGIARNPGAYGKVFTPMILSLALIESLVIFGLLAFFLLFGKF